VAGQWKPCVAYSSPLKRCTQTASTIASASGISVVPLEDLNDVHYGNWEWLTHDEVRVRWPDLHARWFSAPHLVRFPNGESLQDLTARMSNVLRLVLERHRDETVVVVGHSSGNRALLLQTLDQLLSAYWRLGQDPCSASEIQLREDGTTVHRLNETAHLAALSY